ncbi:hypothetical protein CHUAL_006598 [Chamberlinius hualienensis]
MLQRFLFRRNYMLLLFIAVGLFLISYQLTGIIHSRSPENVFDVEEVCTPKRNIVFLKTHKTAGSTVQNIFMRYVNRHGLLVVLPLKDNYLGHPFHFQAQLAPRLKYGLKYNILTHHARFNYDAMRHLMPSDSIYVTILRDPVSLFESLYAYYSLNNTFQMDIIDFANANDSFLEHHDNRFAHKIGRNQMAFDLGIIKPLFDDDAAILRAAQRLDRQFHLVMISEMMDQSLVLLKNLLCWDVDDVVAFKHNARMESMKVTLEPDVQQKLRKWNRADEILYNYFLKKLIAKIKEFGIERMNKEVEELRRKSKDWYEHCISTSGVSDEDEINSDEVDYKFKVYNKQVMGFRLKEEAYGNRTCEDMAKAELPFTKELLEKQKEYLAISTTMPTKIYYRRFSNRFNYNP